MTPEQEHTFVQAAMLGVTCGLEHRYEWYCNALRALLHGLYDEIPAKTKELAEAFLAFEQSTASCPQEEDDLKTIEEFTLRVRAWYGSRDRR